MLKIRELIEKRNKALKQATDLNDKCRGEKRDFNSDESTQYDAWMKEVADLKGEISAEERALELADAKAFAANGYQSGHLDGGASEDDKEKETRALAQFRNYLCGRPLNHKIEGRALQVDTDIKGGFWVPSQFSDMIRKKLDNMVFIRALANIWPTPVPVSQSLGIPTLEADPEDLDWTGEISTVDDDTAMQGGKRTLSSHLLSKLVKVSIPMLQARPDAEGLVAERLAYKNSIVQENAYLNGSGAGRPLGVFTASGQGISTSRDVATDNTSTAVTWQGLANAKYALKAQYRNSASCTWVGHRDFVKQVAKLVDGESRPIFRISENVGQPDTLMGYVINESEYAPNTFASGLYVAVLGDFSFYQITDAPYSVQRLDELYAANNQVGFIARGGGDGMPVFEEAFVRVKLG